MLVPFGNGSRTRQGLVLTLQQEEPAPGTKSLLAVLDEEPVLDEERILLAQWIKGRYFCTLYDAIKAMLPLGLHMRLQQSYALTQQGAQCALDDLSPEQRRIWQKLHDAGKPVEQGAFLRCMGLTADSESLKTMLEQGVVEKQEQACRRVADATRKMVRWQPLPPKVRLTPRQQSVYDMLEKVGAIYGKELCYFTGAGSSVVDALVKKGAASYFEEEVFRTPHHAPDRQAPVYTLTPEQHRALVGLQQAYREQKGGTALLYGITGSGKTLVFLELIRSVLQENKGVIVMVPEIALDTPDDRPVSFFLWRSGCRIPQCPVRWRTVG